jgi:hypothetical protein
MITGYRTPQVELLSKISQTAPDRVRTAFTPPAIGGARAIEAAVPALKACEGW